MWIPHCSISFHAIGIFWIYLIESNITLGIAQWQLKNSIIISYVIISWHRYKGDFPLVLLSLFLRYHDRLMFSFNPYIIIHCNNYSFLKSVEYNQLLELMQKRGKTEINSKEMNNKAIINTTERSNFYLAWDKNT